MSDKEEKIVVLAEDVEIIRMMVANTLRALGYKVMPPGADEFDGGAPNGEQALKTMRRLKNEGKKFVLMSDLSMPELNGAQLLKRMQLEDIKAPTLLFTDEPDASRGVFFAKAGVNEKDVVHHRVATKTFDKPQSLQDALDKAVEVYENKAHAAMRRLTDLGDRGR